MSTWQCFLGYFFIQLHSEDEPFTQIRIHWRTCKVLGVPKNNNYYMRDLLWAHEDVDNRTELLKAFIHADTVTEYDDRKSLQWPNKPRRLSLTRKTMWHMLQSATDGLCTHQVVVFCCLHEYFFPALFSKSPLKSSFKSVLFSGTFSLYWYKQMGKTKTNLCFLHENVI